MVSIKIEYGCGQRYAFEVEPVEGRMASPVACPSCGADGTAAANASIASQPTASTPEVARTSPTLRLTQAAAPPVPAGVKVDANTLGLVGREAAEIQARAKISWGDSQEEVVKYLMLQGFEATEATEVVKVFYAERLAALRVKGIKKIVFGGALMCVPVAAYLFFAQYRIFPIKLMGIAVGIGLWGCWLLLNGAIMLAAPKMESGDVAE